MDGSKQNNATTSAAIINKKVQIEKHLPRVTSIFRAEGYAIDLTLDLVTKTGTLNMYFLTSNLP